MSDGNGQHGTGPNMDSRRAAYVKPKLLRFGDVSELTRAVDNQGNADSGTPPMHKT